jgi:glycosyltransferase involved in cell wall biosynthesis
VSRAQLGIAEEAILMIVVGFRLKDEMSAAWSRQLAGLMLRRPEMTLMLVGVADENPPGFAALPSQQLRILGPREDIGDLLALSDIYINPPRTGGGFSVAEAMAAGLPVLCLADGDGGDKVGPLAVAGMAEYWARLEAYLDDPQRRRRDGAALRGRFTERLDITRSGPSLLRACHSAIALFNARRGLPAAS